VGYELSWESKGLVKRFFGDVTDKQFIDAVIESECDARFDGLRHVINDFRDVESFVFTPDDVDYVAAIDNAAAVSNPHIRIAVITSNPEIIALARQYAESPMNVYPTRIFATLADARAWLDSPID